MTAFHRISRFFLLTAFVTLAVGFFNVAYAAYQTVELGSTITIGEFLYEDDYTASTVDCTISIYDPAGTLKVDTVTMSENANGWHYYSYAVGGAETALGTEVNRQPFQSQSSSGTAWTYVAEWDIEDEFSATITEAGVFNADSGLGGTMLCSASFDPIVKGVNDSLRITWTITIA